MLQLLSEHEHVRVTVAPDFEDVDAISRCAFLVSYTCDVRPSKRAQSAIRSWVESGARWLALHGTNSALDLGGPDGVESPRCFPLWADTLGSQFVAHPPIAPYRVEITAPDHWLVSGIDDFETDDELYLCEYHDREQLHVLARTTWRGEARGFAESDWTDADPEHLVMYVRPLGDGHVLYNTLGHCRGHYDMVPRRNFHPQIERGSWDRPEYHEILRRGIRWAMGAEA